MGSGPVDPKELLVGLDCLLGKDGEIKSADGVIRIYRLMKDSKKLVSRCMYLNILLQTRSEDILNHFISIGGYKLLNNWLTYSKTTSNVPLLQQILLALQLLPLTVDHLKQNNTAKIVKQLSKSFEDEELRKLAQVLVNHWMTVIRSQSLGPGMLDKQPEKKKRKDEKKDDIKVRAPVSERVPEPKSDLRVEVKEEEIEKKREKPKSLRTTAPSHAKFRSTGLEMEPSAPVQPKKMIPGPVISDKYNIKPAPLKRANTMLTSSAAPQVEKKYKPLNVTPNATKEIKVKIIPPQPIESTGFLEALNSAPVHGLKIKKKKKITSPTSVKSNPFDPKASPEQNSTKPASPETAIAEPMDVERSATPVPLEEVSEPVEMATMEEDNPAAVVTSVAEPSLPEVTPEAAKLTKKGKKRKTVSWREESKLREYFYFELDETERVNVNKIKDFGEAAKREMMMDRQAFETARRLSHDTMEEKMPWTCPVLIDLGPQLAERGSSSQEKFIQEEREKGILQEIFLSKDCVPESPHEPDTESYETIPPKVIPLDDENGVEEPIFEEPLQAGPGSPSPDGSGSSKLPAVLANLMGSMGVVKAQQAGPNSNSSLNVQELLTSIMSNQKPIEELVKQPEFSDKIKQLLGPLQQQAPSGQQMMSPPPTMNGFPPGPNNMPHFPPAGPGGPFPGPHGPRMMGPPQREGYWDQPGDGMRGPPHGMRGGGYPRGRGRSNDMGFRGRCGRGHPHGGGRGGHGNGMGGGHNNDMSNRPRCRHFMMKGSCRYESNCAFYHPGVNGPPLP
ncbi:serine/threonine-protein phosphatase 1 regulatory subunit 10 isoform X2 [Narcine bancroftii]|uniref:serine/threonine-protein phosphatase 1 regulatory subunit 10 isoform X2 n=1 Tax=Narcine bancroftii TaxID=1343680 RepID=UPI003831E311